MGNKDQGRGEIRCDEIGPIPRKVAEKERKDARLMGHDSDADSVIIVCSGVFMYIPCTAHEIFIVFGFIARVTIFPYRWLPHFMDTFCHNFLFRLTGQIKSFPSN